MFLVTFHLIKLILIPVAMKVVFWVVAIQLSKVERRIPWWMMVCGLVLELTSTIVVNIGLLGFNFGLPEMTDTPGAISPRDQLIQSSGYLAMAGWIMFTTGLVFQLLKAVRMIRRGTELEMLCSQMAEDLNRLPEEKHS